MQDLQTVPQSLPAVTQPGQLAVADLLRQDALIQQVIKEAMVEGHHYGVIPGTEAREGEKKRPPVLLKPGAEKLCMLFRLAPSFSVQTKELAGGHREERVTCSLTHITTGVVLATAMGSCSTMEAKYRYRNGKPKCPSCGAEAVHKSKNNPEWFCWAKKGGCGATFQLNDARIASQSVGLSENRDLADTYNTVLKMAIKRAHVAATLLATAASDAFIVEEDRDGDADEPDEPRQPQRQERRQQPAKAEPSLSPLQLAARDCAQLASALDWSSEEVAAALAENNIADKFTRWGQLSLEQMEKAKRMFEAALRAGAPVEAKA